MTTATITARTLECGMPLLVERIPGVRSASMCWLLPAGAATEPEDRQGLGAMLAEMVFRGAGERGSREQADALDGLGIVRSSEVGGLFLRLSASMIGDRVAEALPLLAEIVRRPRFDADAIEPVRELCLQSLAALSDEPQERAGILLTQRHAPSPLNRSGLGTEGGLRAIDRAALLAHWENRVRPGGSILAFAGCVDADAVARQLDRLLKGWTGAAAEVALTPSSTAGTYAHEEDGSAQVHITLAYDAPREADPSSLLERVAVAVLSGGTSARLFTQVREKRALCYSVSAAYAAEKSSGRVVAYVGTTPDKAQQSLDVLVEQLRAIHGPGGGVSEEEFRRALVGFKTRLVFAGESTAGRAAALAVDQHRLGRPRSLAEVAAEVDAVTLEGVNGYLARRDPGRMTIVTIGPRPLVPPG